MSSNWFETNRSPEIFCQQEILDICLVRRYSLRA